MNVRTSHAEDEASPSGSPPPEPPAPEDLRWRANATNTQAWREWWVAAWLPEGACQRASPFLTALPIFAGHTAAGSHTETGGAHPQRTTPFHARRQPCHLYTLLAAGSLRSCRCPPRPPRSAGCTCPCARTGACAGQAWAARHGPCSRRSCRLRRVGEAGCGVRAGMQLAQGLEGLEPQREVGVIMAGSRWCRFWRGCGVWLLGVVQHACSATPLLVCPDHRLPSLHALPQGCGQGCWMAWMAGSACGSRQGESQILALFSQGQRRP